MREYRWNDYGRGESQRRFWAEAEKRASDAADLRDAPQIEYDGFITVWETSLGTSVRTTK